MTDLDKILAWVEEKSTWIDNYGIALSAEGLRIFINELKNPPKKLVWHMRSKESLEWKPVTNDEYEAGCHLARFEFKQFEI